MWQNSISNLDQIQKLKFKLHSKTQSVKKKKKLWQNSMTKIVMNLKNFSSDKTKKYNSEKNRKLKFWRKKTISDKRSFGRNNMTPWQPMRFTQGSLLRSRNVYVILDKILSMSTLFESVFIGTPWLWVPPAVPPPLSSLWNNWTQLWARAAGRAVLEYSRDSTGKYRHRADEL